MCQQLFTPTQQHTMELQEGEIYQRIGDDELVYTRGILNEHEPTITIVDGNAIATIPQAYYYSRRIPEGGFTFDDIFAMSSRLRVRGPWLAAQLIRPEFGGVAGAYVAGLATINGLGLNAAADIVIRNHEARRQQQARLFAPALIILPAADATVLNNEIDCPICLERQQPHETWATCVGCDFHSFHLECITHWRGSNCMMCRRQLGL